MKKKVGKKGSLAVKIDLEKAYNRVNWGFLEKILHLMGFSSAIVKVIMFCNSSAKLSLLWNGEKLEDFTPQRGLRERDPYLFVICMEVLE